MGHRFVLLIGLGLLFLLAGCNSTGADETPTPPEPTAVVPTRPQERPTDTIANEAAVESVQVLLMESMPVQVNVEISGSLPNGCVTIESVTSERDGDTFNVAIVTRRDNAALCTEALVPFTERVSLDVFGLPAGTYTVNVAGRSGTLTETFTLAIDNVPVEEPATPPAEPAALELPATCRPQDAQDTQAGPFVNVQDGYCFQYPVEAGFRVHDVFPNIGVTAVWGPPLTPNFEPIRAGLTVHKMEPAAGRSLDEIVAEALATHPEAHVADDAATFAGEPAQIVEGIEGMMDSRRTYLIHDDYLYEITLVPLTQPGEFEEAVMAQRSLLWDTVSGSFTWLPAETIALFADCSEGTQQGPRPESPYVNVPGAYCLLYPSHYGQQESIAQGMTFFTGSALDPTITEPLRGMVTIDVREAANGRSLEQVVDDLLAAIPGLTVQRVEATLGGEPALVVTGLPARSEGRDLFAIHNDQVYHLRIEPLGFPELAEDLDATWELITTSFHFVG